MVSNEYDKLPVIYCKHCLYLGNTMTKWLFGRHVDYCPYCNGTDFVKSSIEKWEQKFEEKYKQGKFLKLNKSWKKIMEEQ